MKLADWLDEYRAFSPDSVERTVAEPVDDWLEEEILASPEVFDPLTRAQHRQLREIGQRIMRAIDPDAACLESREPA